MKTEWDNYLESEEYMKTIMPDITNEHSSSGKVRLWALLRYNEQFWDLRL